MILFKWFVPVLHLHVEKKVLVPIMGIISVCRVVLGGHHDSVHVVCSCLRMHCEETA